MTNELTGKTALVTGASRGIGRATALALAQAGANVAVNFRTHKEEAKRVCTHIEAAGRRAVAAALVRIRQTRRFLHLVRDTLSFRCYARFGDQCQRECSRAVRLIAPSGAIE